MCRSTSCSTCQKTTWFGCGQHVPMVMDTIKEEDRCTCEPKVEKDGKQYPPMGSALGGLWNALGWTGKKDSKNEL